MIQPRGEPFGATVVGGVLWCGTCHLQTTASLPAMNKNPPFFPSFSSPPLSWHTTVPTSLPTTDPNAPLLHPLDVTVYCHVAATKWILETQKMKRARHFPGGPGAKTPCPQCRGPGFNVRELDPTYNSELECCNWKSLRLQRRSKILPAATKTWCSQIYIYIYKWCSRINK